MKHYLEHQFLPAALEVQATPPSPIGRIITWSIVALVALAIAWACWGKMDIVVVAQGKVIPSDRVKTIQPLEIGVVSQIYVHEGLTVRAGDVLLDLDATQTRADTERLQRERLDTELELIRLDALAKADVAADKTPVLRLPKDLDPALATLQRKWFDSEWQERRAKLADLDQDAASRHAERASTAAQVDKLENTLPLITRRAENFKRLAEQKLAPEQQYLELEQTRIETERDLTSFRHQLTQLDATIAGLAQQRQGVISEYARDIAQRQVEAERKRDALDKELTKSGQRTKLQQLIAPVDGVVQQLAVHTVGGVVTPAQPLMVIVPVEDELEIEAFIANKDIGFVEADQVAEVKVEAFPFTKYGTLNATLKHVSYDAVADEKQGLLFATRVALENAVIRVEDKLIRLTPGMAVTVEVKTGTRRVIEYFLSPLMQYVDESGRER